MPLSETSFPQCHCNISHNLQSICVFIRENTVTHISRKMRTEGKYLCVKNTKRQGLRDCTCQQHVQSDFCCHIQSE